MNQDHYHQRAGTFALLPDFLREKSIDPKLIFSEFSINVDDLKPSSMVPLQLLLLVLEEAAEQTNCSEIALLLGARFQFKIHGLIGELMRNAPNLGKALNDFITWQVAYSNSNVVYMAVWEDDVGLGFGTYAGLTKGIHHLYGASMSIGVQMLRQLTEEKVRPVEIRFSHSAPQSPANYREILGAPVFFDQDQTCLVLKKEDLKAPISGADPRRRAEVLSEIRFVAKFDQMPVARKVRHLLRPFIHDRSMSMPSVAAALGVTPRTLRRHLAAEGSTFEKISDEVRLAMAKELLTLTKLDAASIAMALCFSNTSSFNRSFKRWTGTPPAQWRRDNSG